MSDKPANMMSKAELLLALELKKDECKRLRKDRTLLLVKLSNAELPDDTWELAVRVLQENVK